MSAADATRRRITQQFMFDAVNDARENAYDLAAARAPLAEICAWCHPGVTGDNLTHGICATHTAEVLGV